MMGDVMGRMWYNLYHTATTGLHVECVQQWQDGPAPTKYLII